MNKRRLTITSAALILAILLTGCEEYATHTPSAAELTRIAVEWPDSDPNKPTIQAIAIQRYAAAAEAEAIAQRAELTRQAAQGVADRQRAILTAEAGMTVDALGARATSDALDAQATYSAMNVEATRVAEARLAADMATRAAVQATATVDARNARATTDARHATATAISVTAQAAAAQATQTIQAREDNATATVASATTQAVTLRAERERFLHPFKIAAVVLLVLAVAMALAWLGWRFSLVAEDRSRVIRRKPDEGEPIIVWDGEWALPMRSATNRGSKFLPAQAVSAEAQEAATMRQQTANAIQARLAGEIARAKSKFFPSSPGRQRQQLPQPRFQPARPHAQPLGLPTVVNVGDLTEAIEQGVLTPQMAQAIEGQWRMV